MSVRPWVFLIFLARLAAAQDVAPVPPAGPQSVEFTIDSGTRVPLSLINSISTKHSAVGDRLYLETAFPVLANGRIVIPVGSYVAGTVTQVIRPGRVKGKGEIYVRFDSLTLPNGVTRDFHARMGGMDATSSGKVDEKEGKVTGDGNKGGDVRTVAETTSAGTSIGAIAGSSTGHRRGRRRRRRTGRSSGHARSGYDSGAREHPRNGAGPGVGFPGGRTRIRRLPAAARHTCRATGGQQILVAHPADSARTVEQTSRPAVRLSRSLPAARRGARVKVSQIRLQLL